VQECYFGICSTPIYIPLKKSISEGIQNRVDVKTTSLSLVTEDLVGSISAAFSSPVYVPSRVRGSSAGSFSEQRLAIKPKDLGARTKDFHVLVSEKQTMFPIFFHNVLTFGK